MQRFSALAQHSKQSILKQSLFYTSTYCICFPFVQVPTILSPFSVVYTPSPCCLPCLHSPSYLLPSGHVKVPLPFRLSQTYSPMYLRPSANVNSPPPYILLFFHWPWYLQPLLPKAQTYIPSPWKSSSTN